MEGKPVTLPFRPVRPVPLPYGSDLWRKLATDPLWLAEPKHDGYRALIYIAAAVFAVSRHGKPLALTRGQIETLAAYPVGTILDGELCGEDLWLFDCLSLGTLYCASKPLLQRLLLLRQLPIGAHVRPLEGSRGEGEAAYQAALENGAEGLVLKHVADGYGAGIWFKVKPR